jgi:hypothetical protein
MTLPMARPKKHPHSGVYWLRKRGSSSANVRKNAVSARAHPEEAKGRHAEVLSEIEAQWANLRQGARSLTPEEIESVAALLCRAPRASVKRGERVALELRHRLACDQFVAA